MSSRRATRSRHSRALLLAAAVCLLSACASYEPQPLPNWPDPQAVYTESQAGVDVSTAILTDQQAAALYGVDLAEVGLQAIWLRIENRAEHSYWLLVSAMDASYFAPDEAAVLFQHRLSGTDELRATQRFRELAIPLKTRPGAVSEGYVLAPRHEGGRYLPVFLLGESRVLSFGFAVPLLDGEFDFESLQTSEIYAGQELPDVGLDELRAQLRALPPNTTDADGERQGDPLNVVFLGDHGDVLAALARSGWSFTHRIDGGTIRRLIGATISGSAYPVAPISPLYVYGRSQDMALQRARNNILQRNHIRLWLAPFRFAGKSVWVGQVSRDIDIKATTLSPTLTTHVIDPNVDEAREHLLQSLLVSGAVKRFAFVTGSAPASPEAPRANLTEDPYFTDGLRLLVQVSGTETTALEAVEFLDWQQSADPTKTGTHIDSSGSK